jgi:hypothetical protein
MASPAPKTDRSMITGVADYREATERSIGRVTAAKKISAFKVGELQIFEGRHRRLDSRTVLTPGSKHCSPHAIAA